MSNAEKLKLQVSIGKRIRKTRLEKGMQHQDLAAACNFEKANLTRIESGQTNPTIYTLQKIAKSLDVTLSELLKEISIRY